MNHKPSLLSHGNGHTPTKPNHLTRRIAALQAFIEALTFGRHVLIIDREEAGGEYRGKRRGKGNGRDNGGGVSWIHATRIEVSECEGGGLYVQAWVESQ